MYKKILIWVGNIITAILVMAIIGTLFSIVQSQKNTGSVTSFWGYKPMWVMTGSMRPSIQPGDLIITKETKPKDIKVGDVITYRVNHNTFITHRVIDITELNGEKAFHTKGDANNVEDSKPVQVEQLVGVVVLNIPKGGYVITFFRKPAGYILLILLCIICILPSLFKTVLSKVEDNTDTH